MATKTKSIQSFCKNDQEFPVSGYTFATLGLFSALRFFPSPISFESLMISALESGAARLSNKLYVFTIAGQQIDIGPNCGDSAPGDGGSDVPSHPGLLSRPPDLALRAPGHPRPRQARQPRGHEAQHRGRGEGGRGQPRRAAARDDHRWVRADREGRAQRWWQPCRNYLIFITMSRYQCNPFMTDLRLILAHHNNF